LACLSLFLRFSNLALERRIEYRCGLLFCHDPVPTIGALTAPKLNGPLIIVRSESVGVCRAEYVGRRGGSRDTTAHGRRISLLSVAVEHIAQVDLGRLSTAVGVLRPSVTSRQVGGAAAAEEAHNGDNDEGDERAEGGGRKLCRQSVCCKRENMLRSVALLERSTRRHS
jgi:hypothetical protein